MSSVMRGYAQPVTKNFVALENFWPQTEEVILSSLSEGTYTKLGNMYLIDTPQHFADFVDSLSHQNGITGVNPEARQYQPMLDMGKELKFGIMGGESNIITMRKVKLSSVENDVTRSHVAYVVTDNKMTDELINLSGDVYDKVYVRVARV